MPWDWKVPKKKKPSNNINLTRGHCTRFFFFSFQLSIQTIILANPQTISALKWKGKEFTPIYMQNSREHHVGVKKGTDHAACTPGHYTFASGQEDQSWFNSTYVAARFKASDPFSRSESEWLAETNMRMPAGRLHLSRVHSWMKSEALNLPLTPGWGERGLNCQLKITFRSWNLSIYINRSKTL